MNVFVLSTGRCGSTTFIEACRFITNYTSAHESRWGLIGDEHFAYPADHIESDNRLSWFLGRLDRAYGEHAAYVHLRRNELDTARSFAKRYERGILHAYREAVLTRKPDATEAVAVALDYCETVNRNIESFLRDKPRKMSFALENAQADFVRFWELIGARGDLDAALGAWHTRFNASGAADAKEPRRSLAGRALQRLGRFRNGQR